MRLEMQEGKSAKEFIKENILTPNPGLCFDFEVAAEITSVTDGN